MPEYLTPLRLANLQVDKTTYQTIKPAKPLNIIQKGKEDVKLNPFYTIDVDNGVERDM
jgi:hypothetical protein